MKKKNIFFIFLLLFTVCILIGRSKTFALVLSPEDVLVEETILDSEIEFTVSPKRELPEFLITADELREYGLDSAVKLTPQGKRFEEPVQYFRIPSNITSTLDCIDCGDLLSVYVTPYIATGTPVWVNEQNPFSEKYFNRIRLKLFVAGRILFLSAPENNKLDDFVQHMRQRIILNKTSL